jgi:hypothetical protein
MFATNLVNKTKCSNAYKKINSEYYTPLLEPSESRFTAL